MEPLPGAADYAWLKSLNRYLLALNQRESSIAKLHEATDRADVFDVGQWADVHDLRSPPQHCGQRERIAFAGSELLQGSILLPLGCKPIVHPIAGALQFIRHWISPASPRAAVTRRSGRTGPALLVA